MFSYSQFFAGTYFYLLKIENRGVPSEGPYFAMSAVLLIAVSEALLLWGISNIWLGGALMAGWGPTLGAMIALVIVNAALFLTKARYIDIARRYEGDRQRLTWVAATLHAMAISMFFVPVLVEIARMP